ncbi:MarR family winged helix-turn-helix transcriptional regulator [Kribbella sp. NBC_01245]|uniref:MarR family winged helix-turn-helix transcriptional regulator n=1 Tax=Kribbella sp. NBC_01245 TaxID=2903578 RepID=UPI002E2B9DE5|nr:MarR family winged helix-turn-helix transcriptional regulator [Kribbella sp. NBC_01245]
MEREELGALFGRIVRRLIAAEGPVLDEHGLSMWGYTVLSDLAHRPAGTQLALAKAIGYDKSRLIPLLDQLERDGLIVREPDPADRRAHTVRLTEAGQALQAAAQADIRAMENDFLSNFSPADQRALFRMLSNLAHED